MNAGYSYDKYSERFNYGLQGGIVAHSEGVTFGQPLGETVVLVAAPNAKNVGISGQPGIKTDFRGYTVLPYASPYRKNDVTLNTETLDDETEVAINNQTVIPTRGAVVKASFKASIGYRVLMAISQANGQPVPFGATVTNTTDKNSQGFIVGDQGQVYLTGLADSGTLLAKWGAGSDEQCTVNYKVPGNSSGVTNINALCR